MAKKSPAQRAAKKHAKANKRKQKLARREPPQSGVDRWRPAAEGIEGLARRMRWDWYTAALEAEWVAEGRAEARQVWTVARVMDLSTEALLGELERLGIQTDAERFAEGAPAHGGAVRLAEAEWLPRLAEAASVHDRDLARAMSVVLWERWLPGVLSDESLVDALDLAYDAIDEGLPDQAVADLVFTWRLLDDPMARLQRAALADEFLRALLEATEAAWRAGDNALLGYRQLPEILNPLCAGHQLEARVRHLLEHLAEDLPAAEELAAVMERAVAEDLAGEDPGAETPEAEDLAGETPAGPERPAAPSRPAAHARRSRG